MKREKFIIFDDLTKNLLIISLAISYYEFYIQ